MREAQFAAVQRLQRVAAKERLVAVLEQLEQLVVRALLDGSGSRRGPARRLAGRRHGQRQQQRASDHSASKQARRQHPHVIIAWQA